VTQQTLVGCAFCAAPSGTDTGTAYTWGKDERVSYLICVDCATQVTPDPKQRDRYACDSCGLVVDALAALTRFRVEFGHLEGPLQFCADYCPDGAATYWTRDLADHRVESAE
jgi:DNA-directed RNA polymerase subunit RPC12/RpoP